MVRSHHTGYPAGHGDVFFFDNAVGDSGLGDSSTQATVNASDELGARNHQAPLVQNIPITNIYDYNRDNQVNAADLLVARNNPTSFGNVVRFLDIADPPAAPEASSTTDDGGVASARSAPPAELPPSGMLRQFTSRIENLDLNSGSAARFFERLAERNTLQSRKVLSTTDEMADGFGLDDSLLDSLLADLNHRPSKPKAL